MEGARALREVMKTDYPVETLYYSPGIRDKHDMILVEFLCKKADNTFFVSDEIMEYISPASSPQKMMAILPQNSWNPDEVIEKGNYFIAINLVRDPGNLGTIIRSARAFGCAGVILVGECVAWYSPKVVRATAGYILEMPFVSFKDENTFLDAMDIYNIKKFLFTTDSENLMNDVKLFEKDKKTVYIFGGETEGYGDILEEKCNEKIRIPMANRVDSLNLGVSASIVLYNAYTESF
ncbi:MAG: RNA methyltransferase [Candidatus Eremiobacteraeota bacterium]|nr:RNA methyltransferase [Candidatus Eremiobacteraeota bacterium]